MNPLRLLGCALLISCASESSPAQECVRAPEHDDHCREGDGSAPRAMVCPVGDLGELLVSRTPDGCGDPVGRVICCP